MLPFGTEAFRMGLVSVLSTLGACIFIYFIIKNQLPNRRYLPLLGVLIYGLSALVISQSVVVQTYSMIAMLVIGAYYFSITKKWKLSALMLGCGIAVHLLTLIVFILFVIFYKDFRTNWKVWLITLVFGLYYLYIPFRSGVTPYLIERNGADGLISAGLNLVAMLNHFMVQLVCLITKTFIRYCVVLC
jgi:Gpi18-like mannosyltransferase